MIDRVEHKKGEAWDSVYSGLSQAQAYLQAAQEGILWERHRLTGEALTILPPE